MGMSAQACMGSLGCRKLYALHVPTFLAEILVSKKKEEPKK